MKPLPIYTLDQLVNVFNDAKKLLNDGPIRGAIFESFNARSLKQNSTLHMWFNEIAQQFKAAGQNEFLNGDAMTPDHVKDHLKHTYLAAIPVQKLNLDTGEITITHQLPSTKDLDRGEMFHFMNQIHDWAINNHLKLTIPVASEYHQYLQEMGEAA